MKTAEPSLVAGTELATEILGVAGMMSLAVRPEGQGFFGRSPSPDRAKEEANSVFSVPLWLEYSVLWRPSNCKEMSKNQEIVL